MTAASTAIKTATPSSNNTPSSTNKSSIEEPPKKVSVKVGKKRRNLNSFLFKIDCYSTFATDTDKRSIS